MRDNYYKRRRAITALNDELCDPEKCLRAIEHYQIVKRLGEVLHHHLKHDSDFYPVERMCLNFGKTFTNSRAHKYKCIQISYCSNNCNSFKWCSSNVSRN